MENYFFMRPLLRLLGEGRFFYKLVAMTLRVAAALILLFSLATFFKAGKVIFDLQTNAILGGVLFQLFFIIAIYAVVHVLLLRARDIEGIPPAELHSLPVAPLLLKLAGELYAGFVSPVAVGGGIFVWFTNQGVAKIMHPVPPFFPVLGDASFMGGIELMLGGVFIALGVLVLCYILADAVSLLTRSTRPLALPRRLNEPGYKSPYRA